jgi:hypothetical protein
MRWARPPLIAVGVLVVGLSACSTSNGGAFGGSPSAPPAEGPVMTWLAILRVAQDPDELDADTQAVKAVVDGAIMVAPSSCFDGLPDAFARTAYVLGVTATTRSGLDALLANLGRTTLFEGRVRSMCVD